MIEGSLEPEVVVTLGLDSLPVIEVDLSSTSEDAHEAVGSVPAVEEATPKISIPPIFGESVPVPVEGKNAIGATLSSIDLVEKIAWMARELKD